MKKQIIFILFLAFLLGVTYLGFQAYKATLIEYTLEEMDLK